MIPNKRINKFEFWKVDSSKPYYEIVKWFPNEYYGKKDEFEYSPNDNMYVSKIKNCLNYFVSPSVFKNKEHCYAVARFEYDSGEDCYDLRSIGNRIVTSCENNQDVLDLNSLIKFGFEYLENKDESDDYVCLHWPDYQVYMNHEDFKDKSYYDVNKDAYFIPQSIIEKIDNEFN